MHSELVRAFRFEAGHLLPRVPEGHKCRRLHGHSFVVEVAVGGEVDPDVGWVIDFGEVSSIVKPVIEELDHRYLNEIPGLENPTSEVLAAWIWRRIEGQVPGLEAVTIRETCNSACVYRGR